MVETTSNLDQEMKGITYNIPNMCFYLNPNFSRKLGEHKLDLGSLEQKIPDEENALRKARERIREALNLNPGSHLDLLKGVKIEGDILTLNLEYIPFKIPPTEVYATVRGILAGIGNELGEKEPYRTRMI